MVVHNANATSSESRPRMTRASRAKSKHTSDARASPTDKNEQALLEDLIPPDFMSKVRADHQHVIPAIARDVTLSGWVNETVRTIRTRATLGCGDSRSLLQRQPTSSVHLVVTSPPYWTLKRYPDRDGQFGAIADYDRFVSELDEVWREIYRVLVPGGRLVVVVGDVCVSRRRFGRHLVFPLHASIQEHCRNIGFDNVAPIIWSKISNAQFEVENGSQFLGKPYEPNAVIKNDIEFILFQRKPGGYRQPSLAARILSVIPQAFHQECFQQVWKLGGTSTKYHPAPFPLGLAERLVRMFSFVGDTVMDPFMGSGTTNVAAGRWGRHSIGLELEPAYYDMARQRLARVRNIQVGVEFVTSSSIPTLSAQA